MNILNILLGIALIVLVILVLKYLLMPGYKLQGMKDAKIESVISASSLAKNNPNIPSSNFAYSTWFYINDWNYRYGEPKVIFGRMGAKSGSQGGSVPGVSGVDPCPAVVLGAVENNINVSLGCYPGIDQQPEAGANTIVHTCTVANVPIQKWTHLLISVYGRTLDIYIDGKLVRTCLLPGVASINSSADVYVTPQGGFDGFTSNLEYYPYSLNPQDAWNIYVKGYGGNIFSGWMNAYTLQVSVLENGMEKGKLSL